MSAAASRHGRPHAGYIDRPRGYPTEYVPDLPTGNEWDTLTPQPQATPHNAFLPSNAGIIVCWVLALLVVLPGLF